MNTERILVVGILLVAIILILAGDAAIVTHAQTKQEQKVVYCTAGGDIQKTIIQCGEATAVIKLGEDWPDEWKVSELGEFGQGVFLGYNKYPAIVINGQIFPGKLTKKEREDLVKEFRHRWDAGTRARAEMGARHP
jgi:hypothetical protein